MTDPNALTGAKLEALFRHQMAAAKLRDLAIELGKETRVDRVWLILDAMRGLENVCVAACCEIHEGGDDV